MKGLSQIKKEFALFNEDNSHFESIVSDCGGFFTVGNLVEISDFPGFVAHFQLEFFHPTRSRSYTFDIDVHKEYPFKPHRIILKHFYDLKFSSFVSEQTGLLMDDQFTHQWSPAFNIFWLIRFLFNAIIFDLEFK
jgi:hypothetical protein